MMPSLRERAAYHESGHAIAALTFAIPIIRVTIADDVPHLRRGRYRPPHDCGLECIVTLCLAGPEAEREFCGPITDGSDRTDYDMARGYLARQFEPLRAAAAAMPRIG
jgi:hypothetical protein